MKPKSLNEITKSGERSANFVKMSEVLQNKCVDCHSPGMPRMPFYSKLPIAKQLMAKDIEAGARLILSKALYSGEQAFTPLMLARLENTVLNDSMPPTQYLLMYWANNLSADEKQSLLVWIAEERGKLPWSLDSADALKGEPVQPLPEKVSLNPEKVALGDKQGDRKDSCDFVQ